MTSFEDRSGSGPTAAIRELRLPPQSKEAEEAILGALLMDRNAIHRAMEMLEPEHFYQPRHAEIFRAMVTLYSRGEAVDIVTLSEALKKMDKLEVAGGTSYLGGLQESVATGAHVEHYARIVLEKATLRQMISISGEIVDSCFAGREDAMDILDEAESSILSISQGRLKQGFQSSSQLLKETFVMIQKLQDNPESLTGIPSGFAELDKLTGGFQNSDLVIIAGRPSMGKTAFALNLVQNAAIEHKKNVAVFSLEMSNEQLMLRMLTCESRVDAHKLRSGQLREDDWRLLTDAANQLAQSQIFIDDTPAITVLEMRAKCRRLQSQQGLDMIIIDYLQLARGGSKSDNRQQEISEISRGLKGLAKELNVPVLALSQLSRALEARQDKRPMLSDLRESGAIEQDADVVMFVYRPEVYDKENDELEGLSEIIIGKQRNGPIGTAHLAFVKNYTRFEELAHVPFYD